MPDDGKLTAELAAIKERTAKASAGPWKFEREHLHDMDDEPFSLPSVVGADGREIFGGHVDAPGADLRFAAHAREDVPRLVKALEAALSEHTESATEPGWCGGCGFNSPCATVRAITRELTREGNDGA